MINEPKGMKDDFAKNGSDIPDSDKLDLIMSQQAELIKKIDDLIEKTGVYQ